LGLERFEAKAGGVAIRGAGGRVAGVLGGTADSSTACFEAGNHLAPGVLRGAALFDVTHEGLELAGLRDVRAAGEADVSGAKRHGDPARLPPCAEAGMIRVGVRGDDDVGLARSQAGSDGPACAAKVGAGVNDEGLALGLEDVDVVVAEGDALDSGHGSSLAGRGGRSGQPYPPMVDAVTIPQ
jgi:hypothetical protein